MFRQASAASALSSNIRLGMLSIYGAPTGAGGRCASRLSRLTSTCFADVQERPPQTRDFAATGSDRRKAPQSLHYERSAR